MTIKEPESMDELVYFTKRVLGKDGKAMAWVYREDCPECSKAKMGKPIDPKTKKPKTRATFYECPECKHTIPKQEYEDSLQCQIKYTCDHNNLECNNNISYGQEVIYITSYSRYLLFQ